MDLKENVLENLWFTHNSEPKESILYELQYENGCLIKKVILHEPTKDMPGMSVTDNKTDPSSDNVKGI